MDPQNNQTAINVNLNTEIIPQSHTYSANHNGNNNKMEAEIHQPALYGQWKKIDTISETNNVGGENEVIFNRVNHCVFYYKNCIYYYGGSEDITPITNNNGQQNMQNALANVNPSRKETLWNSFHKFNINSKQYMRTPLNLVSNNNLANLLIGISSFGHFVLGNLLFIFGGVNHETNIRRNSQMLSINLESGTIKRYESKTALTSIPSPRLRPLITAIQKAILLLLGGQVYNPLTQSYHYLNDMYTLKIQTKTWTKIQDSSYLKYPILVRPSLVNFGDNCIYLLGGKRQILHNDGNQPILVNNSDMYRLKIVTKTVSFKADCCVKQVYSTNPIPSSQTIIKILKYMDKGIVVVATDVEKPQVNTYFWYYDPHNSVWSQIKHNSTSLNKNIVCGMKQEFMATFEKIISVQKGNQIIELNFNQSMLENVIKQILKCQKPILCSLCQEQKLENIETKNVIPAQYFQEFCSPIQFPFAAIGLLIDNVCLTNAKICNIFFNAGSLGKQSSSQNSKTKYLLIEDNGHPTYLWTSELKPNDFVNYMTSFYSITVPQQLMADEDNQKMIAKSLKQIQEKEKALQREFTNFIKIQTKNNTANQGVVMPNFHFKTQKDFQKQQHEYIEKKQRLQHKKMMLQTSQKCKEFSNNVKLAGLRLGDTVIYACKHKRGEQGGQFNPTDKDIRRFFFMRKEKDTNSGKQYYVCYAYVTQNGNAADPKMESIMKFLVKEFKKQLKLITQRFKLMNNVILITDLKNMSSFDDNHPDKGNNEVEMKLRRKQNDVYYGDASILASLQSNNVTKINECCDISLKTYLSLLYLRRDEPAMYISIKQNSLQLINSQPFLPTIDKMQTSKKIIQVSKSLDFADQCSVVQIYWHPQYTTNTDTIANKFNNLGYMLNGVLIYHRGRLVTRYGIQLGKLLENLQYNHTYGSSIFGFLEIKPQYGTNLYHTDLFYPRAFEKYYAKLNFVNEFMQSKYREKRPRGKGDDGSGYQKVSKRIKHE